MKQKKLKLNIKKLLIRLSFIAVFVLGYLFIKYRFLIMGNAFASFSENVDTQNKNQEAKTNNDIDTNSNVDEVYQARLAKYGIIVEETNQNYTGIGQKKIQHGNGYFTTFTTDTNIFYKEYKQNGNVPWANTPYWDGTMASDGCGITAMSIILSGYGQNVTPETLRQKFYPYLLADNISEALYNSYEIKNSGFYYDSIHLSRESIEKQLEKNKPILICVWNQPSENRWTSVSHYMVLLATDGNGKVYVSNPNGLENSYNSSGWYNIDEILPYTAKALYILENH